MRGLSDRGRGLLVLVCCAVIAGVVGTVSPVAVIESGTSATLLAIALLFSRREYGTLASPLGLFAAAWEGGLFLASLNLVAYDQPSLGALAMLHGSFIVFMAVTLSVGSGAPETRVRPSYPHWMTTLVVALGMLGVALGLADLAAQLGLAAIISQPSALRQARVEGDFGNGIPADLRLFLLAGAVMVRPHSRLGFVLIGASLVWAALSSDRGFFLLIVAIMIVSITTNDSFSGRFHLSSISLLVVVSVALFLTAGALLGKNDLAAAQVANATGTRSALPSLAVEPYIYATGGFVGFAAYTDAEPPGQFGAEAVLTPLSRLRGQKENVIYEFRPIPFSFNIYTYLRGWYDAYGVVGTAVGPALFGFLCGVAYRRRNHSAAWAFFFTLFTAGVVAGISNPNLSYLGFLALFGMCPVLALTPLITALPQNARLLLRSPTRHGG